MNEKLKTAVFALVAVALAVAAYLAVPKVRQPQLFSDQGQAFYAPFDPLDCAGVQVADYDAGEGGPRVFKVELKNGLWVIPSHQDYPADATEQLGKTGAVVNGLTKGAIRSDREKDFALYGVVDPLNENYAGAEGRGKRLTLKSKSGSVLADLIIGKRAEGKPGDYYMRRPDSNRTYACRIDASAISTRFFDWVDTHLLKLAGHELKRIEIDNYHVDESTATLRRGELAVLLRKDGDWTLEGGLGEKEEINDQAVRDMNGTLTDMKLTGVRRKPEDLLKAIDSAGKGGRVTLQELAHIQVLQSIGFYLIQNPNGNGLKVVSNEGELRAYCDDGVFYTLRFGQMVYGEPEQISAAPEFPEGEPAKEVPGKAENRYLFITADFDPSPLGPKPVAPEKPQGAQEVKEGENPAAAAKNEEARKKYDEDLKAYEKKVEDGRKRAAELERRFADWYYIISADAFKKLHLNRADLVREKKPAEEKQEGAAPQPQGVEGEEE